MTTRLDILTILRRDKLRDTTNTQNSPYKWSDDTINEAICEAIRDISQHFPRDMRVTITAEEDQTVFDLPAGFKEDCYLVSSAGGYYTKLSPLDYEQRAYLDSQEAAVSYTSLYGLGITPGNVGHYTIWNNQLLVTPAPTSSMILYYKAMHSLPTSDSDVITVPQEDEDLIILYAWAVCLTRDSAADSTLSRWSEGSGRRDDNPVLLQSTRLFNAYRQKVDERRAQRFSGGY
jgi:hypothetical protein